MHWGLKQVFAGQRRKNQDRASRMKRTEITPSGGAQLHETGAAKPGNKVETIESMLNKYMSKGLDTAKHIQLRRCSTEHDSDCGELGPPSRPQKINLKDWRIGTVIR